MIASLETIELAGGLERLRERSVQLTGYLEALLKESKFYRSPGWTVGQDVGFSILTPDRKEERGAQLSLAVEGGPKGVMVRVFEGMLKRGVVGDERKPDVIRISYVSFSLSLPLGIPSLNQNGASFVRLTVRYRSTTRSRTRVSSSSTSTKRWRRRRRDRLDEEFAV